MLGLGSERAEETITSDYTCCGGDGRCAQSRRKQQHQLLCALLQGDAAAHGEKEGPLCESPNELPHMRAWGLLGRTPRQNNLSTNTSAR